MANVTTSTDIDSFMQSADKAAARTSLGTPASTTTISAGTGLTGGGDLSANRSFDVSYGTTSGTAAQGNDARLSNARTPTNHASSHQSGGSDQITSVALTTGTISGTPSSANDIVNKTYADSIGSGVNFHDACDYGTIAVLSPAATYNQPGGAGVGVNATLTGGTNVALVIDGITVATGKRILVKNQASTFQNGIYNVTQQGDGSTVPYILTRASDYDTSGSAPNEVQAGDFVIVLSSTLANTAWVQQTPAPINFGVTAITFIQFAAANAGVTSFNTSLSGLTPSTNSTGAVTLAGTLAVASGGTGATSAATALANLGGVKTADVQVFTSSGTWTKPANAKSVLIQLISGGGGGGSGRKDTTVLTARGGGGGGGGGNIYEIIVPASVLSATEPVVIGGGGTGGAAVTGPVSNGTAGAQGGTTSIGSAPSFQVPGAFGGGGGGTTGGTGGSPLFNGNSGGTGGLTSQGFNGLPAATNIAFLVGGGGGAGGGPVNITDTAGAGGVGGLARISNLAGGTAGANTGGGGGTGVSVLNAASGIFTTGSGGGGGGAGLSVSGGAGGIGGFPGGGGGGGGATRDGTTSGAGAVGAAGIAIITTYF